MSSRSPSFSNNDGPGILEGRNEGSPRPSPEPASSTFVGSAVPGMNWTILRPLAFDQRMVDVGVIQALTTQAADVGVALADRQGAGRIDVAEPRAADAAPGLDRRRGNHRKTLEPVVVGRADDDCMRAGLHSCSPQTIRSSASSRAAKSCQR